ncbi:ribonuclease H-like domain-containing protein [Echria macrotheca]|uniref:Ribonuclease H-like domain-containing protein n=1 Tax=Echria macrotheca TaxID=438768 RepID=A0AAJ0B0R7_9PEZI|nr:ribonuclease H-like domain-containing protein [Echria macrotheca]
MIADTQLTLYRYAFTVSPATTGRKLAHITRMLLQAPEMAPFRQDVVSDFKSTCVSRQRLPSDDQTISIVYRSEGEDEPRPGAPTYQVRIQFTNTLGIGELIDYLSSTDIAAACDHKQPLIQALNIFLNHHAKSADDIATIGSSRAFSLRPDAPQMDLGGGLAAIRGFFSSVRAATCRILVNVNVSNAAFYLSGPLDQLMQAYEQGRGGDSRPRMASFLKRVRIRTTHLKDKTNRAGQVIHRIKTIAGLATPNDGNALAHPPRVAHFGAGPKQVEFWLESGANTSAAAAPPGAAAADQGPKKKGGKGRRGGAAPIASSSAGKYISVYDFFLNTYGRALQKPHLPVVNVGTRDRPTYLPAEVCLVMPGQRADAKLDASQTQQMIRFAVRKPGANADSIVREGLSIVGLTGNNALLSRFGIQFSPNLLTVPGRTLDEPKVFYKGNKPASVRFGSWNMVDVKFNTVTSVRKWSYLLISVRGYRDAFDLNSLAPVVGRFATTLGKLGITVAAPMPGQHVSIANSDDYSPLADRLERAANAGLELLLVILPENIPGLYGRIKHCGDVRFGIHTVCSIGHKLAKPNNEQYFANVGLKFNLKLGGNNQFLDATRRGILDEDKTMVVGIDVTHPSPGSASNAPSIAGMVASVDRWLGQWPAVVRIQAAARTEMVSDLSEMLKSRLRLWKEVGRHTALPENILVYRDGVSEGQYQTVLEDEVPLLRRACAETYPPADQKRGLPRLTVVIVSKRHHTRFYVTRETDADRSSNPKPGTVVDRAVTEARSWDFYLQSHAAIQGTARPTHYFVVLDEIFRARYAKGVPAPARNVADMLELLTQSLCYTYGRATKAVSVCTPAYYADVVCERARCYLGGVFDATPAASMAGSTSGDLPVVRPEDVLIHARLKNTMFYI